MFWLLWQSHLNRFYWPLKWILSQHFLLFGYLTHLYFSWNFRQYLTNIILIVLYNSWPLQSLPFTFLELFWGHRRFRLASRKYLCLFQGLCNLFSDYAFHLIWSRNIMKQLNHPLTNLSLSLCQYQTFYLLILLTYYPFSLYYLNFYDGK